MRILTAGILMGTIVCSRSNSTGSTEDQSMAMAVTETTSPPIVDQINITEHDLNQCSERGTVLKIPRAYHRVSIMYSKDEDEETNQDSEINVTSCDIYIPHMPLAGMRVLVFKLSCEPGSYVNIINKDGEHSVYPYSDDGCSRFAPPVRHEFISRRRYWWSAEPNGRHVLLKIRISATRSPYSLHILAIPEIEIDGKRKLEMVILSPSQGYIQSYLFDPKSVTMLYSKRGRAETRTIVVPTGQVVLLSVRPVLINVDGWSYVDVKAYYRLPEHSRDKPQNSTLSPSNETEFMVWPRLTGKLKRPPAKLLKTVESVEVSFFVSATLLDKANFRLLYSLHQSSASPEQFENGQWNCSEPRWAELSDHFVCNFLLECSTGRDEADCPYTLCQDDSVRLGDSCYTYVLNDETAAPARYWDDSWRDCVQRSALMASFRTPEQWLAYTDVMKEYMWAGNMYLWLGARLRTIGKHMYRNLLQWANRDKTIAYYMPVRHSLDSFKATMNDPHCVKIRLGNLLTTDFCSKPAQADHVCESNVNKTEDNRLELSAESSHSQIILRSASNETFRINHVLCPDGHVTHLFLACYVESACWTDESRDTVAITFLPMFPACSVPEMAISAPVSPNQTHWKLVNSQEVWSAETATSRLTSPPPYFSCASGSEEIPYTLVCDHQKDCRDASDENFCVIPPCHTRGLHQCTNGQCIKPAARCDGYKDCVDGSDEECSAEAVVVPWFSAVRPPAVIDFDGRGNYFATSLNTTGQRRFLFSSDQTIRDFLVELGSTKLGSNPCPHTHFQCPGGGYCLPVYLRCNGINDCPQREDELFCDKYTCPGFYRCRDSRVCLHAEYVCDGWAQCPQHDDELFCHLPCPHNCTCHGLAFTCLHTFPADQYPDTRYLDAGGSGMSVQQVENNTMLIHLGLASCGLERLHYLYNPNLHSLDLSHNRLSAVSDRDFRGLPRLRMSNLAGNPLTSVFVNSTLVFSMQVLDLSWVEMAELDTSVFTPFPSLYFVNLSNSGVDTVTQDGFSNLTSLRLLDLRGCPMSNFPKHVFQGLKRLQYVYADNYKLCCPVALPTDFDVNKCWAPFNEISSCEALLRSDTYRVFLAVFAGLSNTGNLASLVWRVLVFRSARRSAFSLFVTNLCVADLLMGVYLVIVGVADRLYLGTYLWQDTAWRHSATCRVAGFLSLLSSEASAFIICLITLDRFLVLRFPMSGLHFNTTSAWLACLLAWVVGVALSGAPLLPIVSHWHFYSQTGICLPLPVTRNNFPGRDFAFGVMIVLNFVLFLLIGVGQAFVFAAIRTNSMSGADTTKKSQNLIIARRLATIVTTDFLCWFPVGALGLLAKRGVAIPGEVNVGLAIFVLPLNSALNPFLYTLSAIRERRQRAREERKIKRLMAQLGNKGVEVAAAKYK